LHDEPVEACPPSAAYRFRKFARRHKRAFLTAAGAAFAVLLTATFSVGLIWQANQDLHQALERERRNSYVQRIALADRELSANNLSRMEALLQQCPADLRGWEWHYLKRLRSTAQFPMRHESPVYSVEFSLDGQYLATATKDGVVRLWQAKTGQELQKWPAHEEHASTLSFSHDSRYLATGSWDGTVKLWDVEKVLQGEVSEPLVRLEHAGRVRVWSVAFTPDGQRLATAGGRSADGQGEVKIWDLKSRQEVLSLTSFSDSVKCIQFSPDGRRLATAGIRLVQLWDAQTGQEQLTCRGHNGRVETLAFSPDGRRLASVGGLISLHPDEEIKIWDTHTGEEMLSLRGHVGGLRSVVYSPDGRRLASSGLDHTVKLWDAVTGQEVLTLRGHTDNVFCLAFSPDGHQLASASVDGTVRIWDATRPEREPTLEHSTLVGHIGAVTDVAFHPTAGRSLASAGTDGTVRVWDAISGKQLAILHGPPSSNGMKLAYSPDGRRLATASGSTGNPVRVWELATKKEICNFPRHLDGALCVAFSPGGEHVASVGFDATVRVLDATTAEEFRYFEDHNWPVLGVAFSPDGHHLASGSSDSTVRIWDWTTGDELPALRPQHVGRVGSVAFSRDGKHLASASWDRTIKVWDSETWKLLHDLPDPTGAVLCVAFGPDRRLAWGSTDSTVKVWDGPGTQTHVLRGHTSWVQGVAFSPDGKWIASASLDGTVKIWQAPPAPELRAAQAVDQEK
jgi:WD40 repeat protein